MRIRVDHLLNVDGRDQGPSEIVISTDGTVQSVHRQTIAPSQGRPETTALPLLVDVHAHLGISDGVRDSPDFHSILHIDEQLESLVRFGVGHVHSLGTDQLWLTELLRRRREVHELAPKAWGYSAGIGFGALGGWPPELTLPELRYRPVNAELAQKMVAGLALRGCTTIKLWVDDFDGTVPKTPTGIAHAVITSAHEHNMKVFAHVKYHGDAEMLVRAGVDAFAHSVRDRPMSDKLLELMVDRGVALVPTLVREEAEAVFAKDPSQYLDNPFFQLVAGPERLEMLARQPSSPTGRPAQQLQIGLENVSRADAAGIPIAVGTDGGFRNKLLGFVEHREMQLLVEAGMTPERALSSGLRVGGDLVGFELYPIAAGDPASFSVVWGNPSVDIAATQNIKEVWVNGTSVR